MLDRRFEGKHAEYENKISLNKSLSYYSKDVAPEETKESFNRMLLNLN